MNLENMETRREEETFLDPDKKFTSELSLNELKPATTTQEMILSIEKRIAGIREAIKRLSSVPITNEKEKADVQLIAQNQALLIEDLLIEWKTLVGELKAEGGKLEDIYPN